MSVDEKTHTEDSHARWKAENPGKRKSSLSKTNNALQHAKSPVSDSDFREFQVQDDDLQKKPDIGEFLLNSPNTKTITLSNDVTFDSEPNNEVLSEQINQLANVIASEGLREEEDMEICEPNLIGKMVVLNNASGSIDNSRSEAETIHDNFIPREVRLANYNALSKCQEFISQECKFRIFTKEQTGLIFNKDFPPNNGQFHEGRSYVAIDVNGPSELRGTFGQVKAVRSSKGAKCAIKKVDHDKFRIFELEALRRCHGHPNLPELFGVFIDDQSVNLMMTLGEGGNLWTWLKRYCSCTRADGSKMFLGGPDVLGILKDILSAISWLHSKYIAHLDLKLHNIVWGSRGIMVADFGTAVEVCGSLILRSRAGMTRGFLAPEADPYETIITKKECKFIHVPNLDLKKIKVKSIRFSVKAGSEAHLCLLPAVDRTDSKAYEIVIGGWNNRRSVIREFCKRNNAKCTACTRAFLNSAEFKPFWVSWDAGCIKVGTGHSIGDTSTEFMRWTDPNPYEIGGVSVSTGPESTGGIWRMFIPKEFEVTTAFDVWSVAVTAIFLSRGLSKDVMKQLLTNPQDAATLIPSDSRECSNDLQAILHSMLKVDPALRPTAASLLQRRIITEACSVTVQPQPVNPPQTPSHPPRPPEILDTHYVGTPIVPVAKIARCNNQAAYQSYFQDMTTPKHQYHVPYRDVHQNELKHMPCGEGEASSDKRLDFVHQETQPYGQCNRSKVLVYDQSNRADPKINCAGGEAIPLNQQSPPPSFVETLWQGQHTGARPKIIREGVNLVRNQADCDGPPDAHSEQLNCEKCKVVQANIVCVPCRHFVCENCDNEVTDCPFCFGTIQLRKRLL